MQIGQIVFSKAGRDKGGIFVVIRTEGDYAYLADGETRRLEKPKKKKFMHIQKTNNVCGEIKEKIEEKRIMNSDIAKAIHRINLST